MPQLQSSALPVEGPGWKDRDRVPPMSVSGGDGHAVAHSGGAASKAMSPGGNTLATRVWIPRHQRDLHVAAEWGAVLVVVPALAWVALNPLVPTAARLIAGGVALASLVVDGYLLGRWRAIETSPAVGLLR